MDSLRDGLADGQNLGKILAKDHGSSWADLTLIFREGNATAFLEMHPGNV